MSVDALQHGASQFEQQAGKLKRKYWWKNLKVCYDILVLWNIHLGLFETPEFSKKTCCVF